MLLSVILRAEGVTRRLQLEDHHRLDGNETSSVMLELLNSWAIPNFHDMRRLSSVFSKEEFLSMRKP